MTMAAGNGMRQSGRWTSSLVEDNRAKDPGGGRFAAGFDQSLGPGSAGNAAGGSALCACALAVTAAEEWRTYGHDYGDSRYSPLAQITPANVAGLKPAWTYHMRPADRTARGFAASENTPLVVGGS